MDFNSLLGGDLVSIITRVGVLLACFWFGKKAISGYRKKLNFFFRFLAGAGVGLFCYASGLILSKRIPLPFSEFIGAGISTIIVFIVLRLVSPVEELDSKFVLRSEYETLLNRMDGMKQKIVKLEKALADKGLQPKTLSNDEISGFVDKALKLRGYGSGNVLSKKLSGDVFDLLVSSGKKKFDVSVNAYSGDLVDFGRHSSGAGNAVKVLFEELFHNKSYLAALIIFGGFLYLIASSYTPSDYSKILFVSEIQTASDCPNPSELETLFSQGAPRYDLSPSPERDSLIESVLGTRVIRNVYGYTYKEENYAVVETLQGTCSVNLNQIRNCGCI